MHVLFPFISIDFNVAVKVLKCREIEIKDRNLQLICKTCVRFDNDVVVREKTFAFRSIRKFLVQGKLWTLVIRYIVKTGRRWKDFAIRTFYFI